jgi:hypothetical protein
MSLHINRFVDRLRGFEARNQKEFTMSLNDAKDLHADITRLLNRLQALQEQATNSVKDETVRVELTGGKF